MCSPSFDERRAGFLRRVVAAGKTGRTWTTLDPDAVAAALGEERSRIVAALEHLDERRLIELQAAEARQRFTVVRRPDSLSELRERLAERSERREQVESERIERVVSLVTNDGCQVNALVAYFGEERDEPCGHCSFCLGQMAQALPPAEPLPEIASLVDARALGASAGGAPRTRSPSRGRPLGSSAG